MVFLLFENLNLSILIYDLFFDEIFDKEKDLPPASK